MNNISSNLQLRLDEVRGLLQAKKYSKADIILQNSMYEFEKEDVTELYLLAIQVAETFTNLEKIISTKISLANYFVSSSKFGQAGKIFDKIDFQSIPKSISIFKNAFESYQHLNNIEKRDFYFNKIIQFYKQKKLYSTALNFIRKQNKYEVEFREELIELNLLNEDYGNAALSLQLLVNDLVAGRRVVSQNLIFFISSCEIIPTKLAVYPFFKILDLVISKDPSERGKIWVKEVLKQLFDLIVFHKKISEISYIQLLLIKESNLKIFKMISKDSQIPSIREALNGFDFKDEKTIKIEIDMAEDIFNSINTSDVTSLIENVSKNIEEEKFDDESLTEINIDDIFLKYNVMETSNNENSEIAIEKSLMYIDESELIESIKDIVVCLIDFKMYNAALATIERIRSKLPIDQKIEIEYLRVNIFYLRKEFHFAISEIESYLESNKQVEQVSLESFLYMKAECLFKLEKFKEAGRLYQKLNKFNKNYRLVKERLLEIARNK